MYSSTMIHGVKDVKIYDGLYRGDDEVKSTRDIMITLVDGGEIKIMCFVKKEGEIA